MSHTYRIGVLGLTHDHVWRVLEQLAADTGGKLVAGADPNQPLLNRLNDSFGCATYKSAEELFDRERLDAVYVFADNRTGAELGIAAATRGLHILLEKPMAADLAGADQLLAAARRHDVRLMVNWPFAWSPQLQTALRLARAGEIGEVWQVKYRAAHQGPKEHGCSPFFYDWLYDERLNGAGALMDYCCYGAVLARVVLGVPSRVTGFAGRLQKEYINVDDNALVVMTYPRGMAIAEASWTQIGNLTSYVTVIYGSSGTLVVEPGPNGRLLRASEAHPDGRELEVASLEPHLAKASDHFLWALASGASFTDLCQDRIARDAQEILQAGIISARRGSEVSLPLPAVSPGYSLA